VKSKLEEFETISDTKEIEKICDQVIKNNPKAVQDYRAGQKEAFNYLVGEIMKASKRKADFKTAKAILEKKLKSE